MPHTACLLEEEPPCRIAVAPTWNSPGPTCGAVVVISQPTRLYVLRAAYAARNPPALAVRHTCKAAAMARRAVAGFVHVQFAAALPLNPASDACRTLAVMPARPARRRLRSLSVSRKARHRTAWFEPRMYQKITTAHAQHTQPGHPPPKLPLRAAQLKLCGRRVGNRNQALARGATQARRKQLTTTSQHRALLYALRWSRRLHCARNPHE